MRYALMRFKATPPKERPVGMNDIMGLSEYKSVVTAKRFLWDSFFWLAKYPGQRTGVDALKELAKQGYTYFGLYEVPNNFGQPDRLVETFKNPYPSDP